MQGVWKILVAVALASPAHAAMAQPVPGEVLDVAQMSDAELNATLDDETSGWVQQPCKVGIPIFAELGRRAPDNESYQRGGLMAQSLCASRQGDPGAAIASFDEFERRFGEVGMDQYRIALAFNAERPAEVLDRLERMVARDGGRPFADLEADYYFAILRALRKAGLRDDIGRFSASVYMLPLFADLSADMQQSIATNALLPMIDSGDEDLIRQLLLEIRNPVMFSDFLASREYESAWPLIEERVGPAMSKVTGGYREWAMARLANASYDRDRFSDAAHSLLFDGKFEDAVALVKKWRDRPGAFDRIEEGDGWAVNIEAYALDGLGRFDEADALFDRLAAIDAEKNNWVVNFVINRSSRLVGHGRWEDGLEAAALARKVAENHGSLYAKMLVGRDMACANAALSRTAATEQELAFLVEKQGEFAWITVQALQCAGKDEQAVSLLLETLDNETERPGLLSVLQDDRFDLFYTPSILPKPYDLVGSSPAVRAAFDKYARVIPLEFAPAASIRRQAALKRKR